MGFFIRPLDKPAMGWQNARGPIVVFNAWRQ
jgi:hypothetical protein